MRNTLVNCINQLHMARGYQTIFKGLFDDTEGGAALDQAEPARRKGRDPVRHSKRTECLVDRYYYYVRFNREWRYEYVLEVLSEEFWLSPDTIPDLLTTNDRQLATLKRDKPDKGWFKKKWSHLVWN